MPIAAQTITELRARTSAKWRSYPDDVLPLFVAEMDFALAEPIVETLHDAIRRNDTGYAYDSPELCAAYTEFALHRYGWRVDPTKIRTTADVSMGIVEVLRRVTEPGDRVIIMPPVYAPFYDLIPEAGAVTQKVPLLHSTDNDGTNGWALDLDGIDDALRAGAKAIVLCNPHNPLGRPHPRGELEKLAELAERHGVTVISDEIHGPLTHSDGHYTPYLTVSDAARDHGVIITSASKGWNLAGLKCAIIVTATARMQAIVDSMYDEVFWRTSIFGIQAATAAFRDGTGWLDGVLETLESNKRLLGELLAEKLPGVGYREPTASYLAWLDFRELGLGDDPSAPILEKARVALNPGPSFGAQGTGFARLNFGCSPEVLTEAIQRISDATLPQL